VVAAIAAFEEAQHATAAAGLIAGAYPHRRDERVVPGVRRWVADDASGVVGYAALWPVHAPKFRIDVIVARAARGCGIGDALLRQVIAAADVADARTIQARPDGADDRSMGFLRRRGFDETMRVRHLVLALAEARHAEHRAVFDRLAGDGIAIVTLADFLARRPDDGPSAYIDLMIAAREGWPDPDPDGPGDPPVVVDREAIVRARQTADVHAIVAEQRGRLVGFTGAHGTGVRPDSRGRGIATALAVAAIDAAIGRGETTMAITSGSEPMRHIREKLGFREHACEVRMVRRLR
jgi:GNAT superfamily N-acetyltransferase